MLRVAIGKADEMLEMMGRRLGAVFSTNEVMLLKDVNRVRNDKSVKQVKMQVGIEKNINLRDRSMQKDKNSNAKACLMLERK